MNTPIPKITKEQAEIAFAGAVVPLELLNIYNERIDAANSQQETYITAEEARELVKAGGQAEWRHVGGTWAVIGDPHAWFEGAQYRAIKAQPEPVPFPLPEHERAKLKAKAVNTEMRAQLDAAKTVEPVDLHAALRAEYAKQVEDGTLSNFVWSFKNKPDDTETECVADPVWSLTTAYFCTPKSEHYAYKHLYCSVSKYGEPAKRMLRTAAQELYIELGNTVDWSWKANGIGDIVYAVDNFDFTGGTYTYRTKATIKLDGSMVTPEQAKSQWEAKKETHDLYYLDMHGVWVAWLCPTERGFSTVQQYELRPKALKQVSWSDMPAGAAVRCNDTDYAWILQGVGDNEEALITVPNNKPLGMRWIDSRDLTLAPTSEQPWMYWGGGECPVPEGVTVEIEVRGGEKNVGLGDSFFWGRDGDSADIIAYKITGIAKGYVLEGAV